MTTIRQRTGKSPASRWRTWSELVRGVDGQLVKISTKKRRKRKNVEIKKKSVSCFSQKREKKEKKVNYQNLEENQYKRESMKIGYKNPEIYFLNGGKSQKMTEINRKGTLEETTEKDEENKNRKY